MDDITKEALEASIKHWEENAEVRSPSSANLGIRSCALCKLFYCRDCAGCPVAQKTNQRLCYGSPHTVASGVKEQWRNAYGNNAANRAELGEAFRAAARAEVEFLKGLRDGRQN